MPRLGAGRGIFGGALPRGDSEHSGGGEEQAPASAIAARSAGLKTSSFCPSAAHAMRNTRRPQPHAHAQHDSATACSRRARTPLAWS